MGGWVGEVRGEGGGGDAWVWVGGRVGGWGGGVWGPPARAAQRGPAGTSPRPPLHPAPLPPIHPHTGKNSTDGEAPPEGVTVGNETVVASYLKPNVTIAFVDDFK